MSCVMLVCYFKSRIWSTSLLNYYDNDIVLLVLLVFVKPMRRNWTLVNMAVNVSMCDALWPFLFFCTIQTHCCGSRVVAECHSTTDHWHTTPWSYHASITWTALATHPRAHQVQSGIPGSLVAVWTGASLLGRWLLSCFWQYSTLTAVSGRSDLRGATNTQQLQWQNFCSRRTPPVELSSSLTMQSGHHLRTLQTTAEGTPFLESMNTVALCDFDMRHLRRTLAYLLTYRDHRDIIK